MSSFAATGCGAAIGEVAGAVPGPVIEETLETLNDPQTQAAITEVLSSPEYRNATRELLGNVTDGTLDALSDEERRARLGELADAFVGRMAASLGQVMRTDLGAAVAATVAQTMDRVLDRALSEENGDRLAQMVARIAHEAVVALASAVREDLAPAVRDLLADEEVSLALGATARQIAREVVLGTNEGVREVERTHPDTLLSMVQSFATDGISALIVGALLLALLAVIVIARRLFNRRKSRLVSVESDRRELAVLSLLSAMKSAEEKPWGGELRALLKESFRDNEDADYLREVLRKNRHLRMAEGNGHDNGHDHGSPLPHDRVSSGRDAHGHALR